MGDLRIPLTDKNVLGLPAASSGQYRVRDTELPGFFVLVGSRTKSFMVQGDLRAGGGRRSVRLKVAAVGELSTRDARTKARALLGQISAGTDPRTAKRKPVEPTISEAPTLRQAWARYRDSHLIRKSRSDATVRHYTDHVERLLADWLDRKLSEFGEEPRLVADRHEHISKVNGPAIANGAMRSFRAIYNHARKTCRSLPAENPTFAIDWNPERRRDTALGAADLPVWFEQLAALENPVRREFHLLSILSGSRPDALKRVELAHVNLRERVLHIPRPKGGEEMAFDIPLSRPMLEAIIRLRRLARVMYPVAAGTWLFPSDAPVGYLIEHKEDRSVLSHWGNDLRQTYRTLGQAAGLTDVDMHLLMNHALPGINAGYITRSKLMRDHLRRQQEKLSRFVIDAVAGHGRRPSLNFPHGKSISD